MKKDEDTLFCNHDLQFTEDFTVKCIRVGCNVEYSEEQILSILSMYVAPKNLNIAMDNSENFVKVWRFDDAPEEYRKLSTNAGDEDWIAFVPDSLSTVNFWWMDEGTPFGYCHVDDFPVEGGYICIGSHS